VDDLVSGHSSGYVCSRRILWPVIGRGRKGKGVGWVGGGERERTCGYR